MDLADAVQIVTALADGRDPLTGIPLSADHLCQNPQVVRALCVVVERLKGFQERHRRADDDLENAGRPWTQAEKGELVRAFEAGATIGQLARKHGRTRQAIQGRLYLLGKVPHGRRFGKAKGDGQEAAGSSRGLAEHEQKAQRDPAPDPGGNLPF
jgi:transposase-like protein